jgi:uncharacterized membrane protein (UPF0136 family)
MKTAKITIGILCMLLFIIMVLGACAFSLGGAFTDNDGMGSSSPIMIGMALLFLVAGIISVAGSKSKGASLAASIVFGLNAALGITNFKQYMDIGLWMIVAVFLALLYFIFFAVQKSQRRSAQ